MKKILFIGDSITDCGHLFDHPPLGNGYVKILFDFINREGYCTTFKNLGTDGFTISRALERFSQYSREYPDIIIILLGINDIGLMMNTNRTLKQQESMMDSCLHNYHALLEQLQTVTEHIIILEPFIFPYPAEFRHWIPYVKKMNSSIQKLSSESHCSFIPLQDFLNHHASLYGYNYITSDGVHLTLDGHKLVAQKVFETLCDHL